MNYIWISHNICIAIELNNGIHIRFSIRWRLRSAKDAPAKDAPLPLRMPREMENF